MNVHVRFLSVATLVALASSAIPVDAQPATPVGLPDPSAVGPAALPSLPVASRVSLSDPGTPRTQSVANDSATVTARGPSIATARVAVRQLSAASAEAPLMQDNGKSKRRSLAFMIVGGAALVIGAVIGDDAGTIVMLGGAAIGLYGLYMFLT